MVIRHLTLASAELISKPESLVSMVNTVDAREQLISCHHHGEQKTTYNYVRWKERKEGRPSTPTPQKKTPAHDDNPIHDKKKGNVKGYLSRAYT